MPKLLVMLALALLTPLILFQVSSATPEVDKLFESRQLSTLTIRNTSLLPRTVYARFEYPVDPENRNYGFVQTLLPGQRIKYEAPAGTRIYACDGKYWDNYSPKEKLLVTADGVTTYRFTANEFKP